jgi:hypothetical protein
MMRITAIPFFLAGAISLNTAATHAEEPVQTIAVERHGCLGECLAYRFEVHSDGSGLFTGTNSTVTQGELPFSIAPDIWTEFRSALAPYRPRGNREIVPDHPRCRFLATDHPFVSVTWKDKDGTDSLRFYFGCRDPENETMSRVLSNAPDILLVKALDDRFRPLDHLHFGPSALHGSD